ncbi:unnamed protein product [Paramecium sonneborni]|uniref:Uncharacterized protein n=1 Tax=Paramecium sonneborni TaxID=65129 RepID=A0A8S1QXW7_9CILI|nr:unnamed protein product [Paramecium sonneborni]
MIDISIIQFFQTKEVMFQLNLHLHVHENQLHPQIIQIHY